MSLARQDLGIIIQARMGSKRLPGKVLKKIGDKTLVEHIYCRLSFLKHSAKIVLATSTCAGDDVLEKFCAERSLCCYRGSEHNVLERYYECAKENGFLNIVRLTADNPFTDMGELDNLIEEHLRSDSDYTSSLDCLPVGVGAEVFTFKALEKSYREGHAPHHIEHVDEYILENPGIFKCKVISTIPAKSRHDIRLTVDTLEDYRMACRLLEISKSVIPTTLELIESAESYACRKAL